MLLLGPPTPVDINIPQFYLKYLPWLLIFVFTNAAMEELLFRGIFIKTMKPIIGATLSIIISSIVFALAHMQVSYQSSSEMIGFVSMVLVLALLWAFIMYKTESLIASIFFHAGADMVIMISIYKSAGIIT
jgi:membrane protease YdiL (CAAX protease family)